jgi:uncharacterized protein
VRLAKLSLAALILSLGSLFCFALDYPALTGRVVDQANVMTAQSRTELDAKLKDLEDKSSIQLVVATVKSLQGKRHRDLCQWLVPVLETGPSTKKQWSSAPRCPSGTQGPG